MQKEEKLNEWVQVKRKRVEQIKKTRDGEKKVEERNKRREIRG